MTQFVMGQETGLSVESNLVRVPLVIMDRDGRYVSGVEKKDLRLSENGDEQEIVFLEPSETPFSLMIVADVSGSMASHMADLGRAIDTLINKLRPDDTIIFATFSNWDLQYRISQVKKKDYQYKPANGAIPKQTGLFTTTFDAVEDSISYVSRLRGRKAIIFFGDGEPFGSRATAKSNLKAAEEQEALIYTIRYGDYPTGCVLPRGVQEFRVDSNNRMPNDILSDRDLSKKSDCPVREIDLPDLIKRVEAHFNGLAEKTGGRAYKIKEISNLADTFSQIVSELGQTYVIGYEPKIPTKDGERRKIAVKVNIPNVAVRSRNEVVYKKKP